MPLLAFCCCCSFLQFLPCAAAVATGAKVCVDDVAQRRTSSRSLLQLGQNLSARFRFDLRFAALSPDFPSEPVRVGHASRDLVTPHGRRPGGAPTVASAAGATILLVLFAVLVCGLVVGALAALNRKPVPSRRSDFAPPRLPPPCSPPPAATARREPPPPPSRQPKPLLPEAPSNLLAAHARLPRLGKGLPAASRHLCPGLVVPAGMEFVLTVPDLKALGETEKASSSGTCTFEICELAGAPVIEVAMAPRRGGGTAAGSDRGPAPAATVQSGLLAERLIRLRAARGGPVLAYCRESPMARGRRGAEVLDIGEEPFASITEVLTPTQRVARVQLQDRWEQWAAAHPLEGSVGLSLPLALGDDAQKDAGTLFARPRYVLTSELVGLRWTLEGDFDGHHVVITDDEHARVLAETAPCGPTAPYYHLRIYEGADAGMVLCAVLLAYQMEER